MPPPFVAVASSLFIPHKSDRTLPSGLEAVDLVVVELRMVLAEETAKLFFWHHCRGAVLWPLKSTLGRDNEFRQLAYLGIFVLDLCRLGNLVDQRAQRSC